MANSELRMGMPKKTVTPALKFHPVTPRRWRDLEKLFGERGAYGGCWCMWWRLTRSQFSRQVGQKNKRALKKIVDSGEVPGILLYAGREPIGWCSVAPREDFGALERSRTLKRVDDQPVWSVVCFFVAKPYRRQGVQMLLLKAAVEYAKRRGAKIIEGYPLDSKSTNIPDVSSFVGLASVFRQAGFVKVARRSRQQAVMRYYIVEQ